MVPHSHTWPMVALGEILVPNRLAVRVDRDGSYPNFGIYSFGRGLFAKQPIDGALTSASMLYQAHVGQFVYSRLFAFEGAYGVVTPQFDKQYVSNEFPLFDCNHQQVVPAYLAWYFRSRPAWEEVAKLTTGMGNRRQRVPPDRLLAHRISLPPLEQQRRIVATLDELLAKIAESRQLHEQLEAELAALPRALARSLIGSRVQSHWKRLGDCVYDIENGWSPACSQQPASNGEWGVLKVGAVSFGTFAPRQNKALPPALRPIPELEIRPGDFLMSRANTVELVGACAIVHDTPPRLLLCDKIFRFIFRQPSPLEPRFLECVLKSPALREQIERGATGTSPTMRNISKAKILDLRIPVPSLDSQRQMIARLHRLHTPLSELTELRSRTAAELAALLPRVLKRAFDGELVPQDPVAAVATTSSPKRNPLMAEVKRNQSDKPKHSGTIFYRRAAIAAYIIDRLHARPTFGRVQLEKCLYLAEAYVGVDLEGEFKRAAAGPLDAEYLYKLESAAQKNGWFVKRTIAGDKTRHTYHPGAKSTQLLAAAAKYLGTGKAKMDALLGWMEKFDTERAEIVATLFAAWSDLLRAGHAVTDDAIITEVRDNWHESKKRFEPARLRIALGWMREHRLAPNPD